MSEMRRFSEKSELGWIENKSTLQEKKEQDGEGSKYLFSSLEPISAGKMISSYIIMLFTIDVDFLFQKDSIPTFILVVVSALWVVGLLVLVMPHSSCFCEM